MDERNLLVTIKFDGACFAGWQVQKNAVAVMEVLQNAIEVVLKHRPDIKGCSRTDSGVHALNYCVSFRTTNKIPVERMVPALNCNLPYSIVALSCVQVEDDFHARYATTAKRYIYKILNTKERDPFWDKRCWHVERPIDVDIIKQQGQDLVGRYDFLAFSNAGSKIIDTHRTIYSFDAYREGDMIIISVCGDGFLYNMVRIIVGTLVNIEGGSLKRGSIPSIIAGKDRKYAGVTAPAAGLYLDKVFYDDGFLKDREG